MDNFKACELCVCVGRHWVWFDGCCDVSHWVNTVSLSTVVH